MLSNPELAFGLSVMAEVDTSDGVTVPRKKALLFWMETCMTRNVSCVVGRYDWCESLFFKINY